MLALAVETGTRLLKCLEKKGSEVKRTEREKGGIPMASNGWRAGKITLPASLSIKQLKANFLFLCRGKGSPLGIQAKNETWGRVHRCAC